MIKKTRVVVAATLTLTVLTGCGEAAARATPTHIYSPLPPFTSATPAKSASPAPSPTPAPGTTPKATSQARSKTASGGGQPISAVPSQELEAATPEPATTVPGDATSVRTPAAAIPVQIPAAPVSAPTPVAADPVQSAVGDVGPVRSTKSVSTTSTVTTTTLAAYVLVVVTCEEQCILNDLNVDDLKGEQGPISPEAWDEMLNGDSIPQGEKRLLTEEIIKSLIKRDWHLRDKIFEDGQERLMFTSDTKPSGY
jgi:hypothetical protein